MGNGWAQVRKVLASVAALEVDVREASSIADSKPICMAIMQAAVNRLRNYMDGQYTGFESLAIQSALPWIDVAVTHAEPPLMPHAPRLMPVDPDDDVAGIPALDYYASDTELPDLISDFDNDDDDDEAENTWSAPVAPVAASGAPAPVAAISAPAPVTAIGAPAPVAAIGAPAPVAVSDHEDRMSVSSQENNRVEPSTTSMDVAVAAVDAAAMAVDVARNELENPISMDIAVAAVDAATMAVGAASTSLGVAIDATIAAGVNLAQQINEPDQWVVTEPAHSPPPSEPSSPEPEHMVLDQIGRVPRPMVFIVFFSVSRELCYTSSDPLMSGPLAGDFCAHLCGQRPRRVLHGRHHRGL